MIQLEDRERALEWVLQKLSAAKKGPSIPVLKPIQLEPLKPIKPIEFNVGKPEELKDTRTKELSLWKTWKAGGEKPKDLSPLLDSYKRLINKNVNVWKNKVEIPTSSIEFEAKRLFVNAIREWDHKKGASLPTYISLNLKKLGRYCQARQNPFGRMPEHIVRHVGTYQSVKSELTDKLGHEPDDITLHEECSKIDPRITLGHIKRLNKEIRKQFITTGREGTETLKMVDLSPKYKEIVGLIYHQLSPEERVVHEYWFGLNGKPKLTTGQIAKKQKWDDPKVSKIKKTIFNKMTPYLEE